MDEADAARVLVGGVPCAVAYATLEEVQCVTGDLDAADEHGDPSAHYALDDDDAARASKPYVACERARRRADSLAGDSAPDSLAGDPAIGIRESRARAPLNRYDTDALRQHNRSAEFAPLRPLVAEADDAAPAVVHGRGGAWRATVTARASGRTRRRRVRRRGALRPPRLRAVVDHVRAAAAARGERRVRGRAPRAAVRRRGREVREPPPPPPPSPPRGRARGLADAKKQPRR